MNVSRPVVAVALALSMPAFAAVLTEDAAPTRTPAAPVRVASAGIAPSLPDVPDTVLPYTQMPFWLINVGTLEPVHTSEIDRLNVDEPPYNSVR